MPFEIPQDKHQKELLSEINATLKQIQTTVDSLNKRINKLEIAQNNFDSHIITDVHNQISSITNKLDQFNYNKSNNSSFGGLILIIVVIASIVFGWHFWDVPAQTNAINQYICDESKKAP